MLYIKESGIVIKNNNHSNKNKELKIIISNNYTTKTARRFRIPPRPHVLWQVAGLPVCQRVKHLLCKSPNHSITASTKVNVITKGLMLFNSVFSALHMEKTFGGKADWAGGLEAQLAQAWKGHRTVKTSSQAHHRNRPTFNELCVCVCVFWEDLDGPGCQRLRSRGRSRWENLSFDL